MFEKQKNFSRKIGEVFTFFRGNAAAPFPIDLRVQEVAEPKCVGCYFYRPDKKSDNNPYGCTKIFAYEIAMQKCAPIKRMLFLLLTTK